MKSNAVFQLAAALAIAAVSFSTSSVRAESTESVNAVPVEGILKPPPEFTAMEFGQSATFGQGVGSDVVYGGPYILGGYLNGDLSESSHSGNLVFGGLDVIYFGGLVDNGRSRGLPARSLD